MNQVNNNDPKDEILWQIAKDRVSFKKSLVSYIAVNLFLIGVWYFNRDNNPYFWPIWPILGWGLGLTFQYLKAYQGMKINDVEKEFQKLKNQ